MAFPLSKSQVERLGKRLVASDQPEDADLQLLHELLLSRSGALEAAITRVRDHLQLAPTSRIKNTGTIFEKLRRSSGSGLKSMQDLAGMRIVGTFDRRGQDASAAELANPGLGDRIRVATVAHALSVAGLIAAFEEAELLAPDPTELKGFRGGVEEALVRFRGSVQLLHAL